MVVEQKVGATGLIANDFVAKSTPDGYNMVLLTGGHPVSAAVMNKLPYDPVKDLLPVVDKVIQSGKQLLTVDAGAGVLRLYGNYGGDIMNFDMAGDLVEFDDIRCTTVILADDVASAPKAEAAKRRQGMSPA